MKTRQESIESQKIKLKSEINKFINEMNKFGVSFSPTDGEFDNIVLSKEGFKDVKIYHEIFYRVSGPCVVYIVKEKNQIDIEPMTDAEFYIRMKYLVLMCNFGVENF